MNKIQIDLDNKIIEYVKENIKQDIDMKKHITDIVNIALEKNNIDIGNIYVSIQSATLKEIRDLNRQYRNIDRPTDVLSFPIFEKEEFEELIKKEEDKKIKELELGDIIICMDIVEKQSVEYKTGLLREVLYMITHGVCHLLGYDHIVKEDKDKMRELEEYILGNIGVF